MNNNKKNKVFVFAFLAVFLLGDFPAYSQSAFDDPGARNVKGETGNFVSVDKKTDAGIITLGASSQVVILFKNNGGKPVTTGSISLYPSSNVSASVAKNECAQEPVETGAVCAIAMSVKGLQPGKFRIEMLMRHDGRAKLITSTISGGVESSDDKSRELISDIESIPEKIDFGTLSESRPLVRSVILRNVTSKVIDISSIEIEANAQAGFLLNTDCDQLETGEACIGTVTWTPQQRGPATGVLVVRHSGPTGVNSIVLDGDYSPGSASEASLFPDAVPGKGLLTASQSDVDFGSSIETSSAITVSLVNVGDAPLSLRDIKMSNEDNGIRVAAGGCAAGIILDPVEACPLTLVWDPVREGSIIDDIQITHNGARGILVLPLRGSATKVVNKDSKAIMLSDPITTADLFRSVPPVSASSVGAYDAPPPRATTQRTTKAPKPVKKVKRVVDVRGVLDGFRITSLASRRAIVAGPGGSRVVFDGEEAVIGGVLWDVGVRRSGVEFSHANQKVLLLFDKSLSTFDSGIVTGTNNSNNDTSDN